MNSLWILVLVTSLSNGDNLSFTTQEFSTKASCTKAGNSAKSMLKYKWKVKKVTFTCEKK